MNFEHRPGWLAGAALSLAAAIVWFVLAWRTPTNTYHFAPLIVAAALPIAWRVGSERIRARPAAIVASASTALTLLAGGVLSVTDHLRGPSLWGEDGAMLEVALFAVIGGLYGYRSAARTRQGLLF